MTRTTTRSTKSTTAPPLMTPTTTMMVSMTTIIAPTKLVRVERPASKMPTRASSKSKTTVTTTTRKTRKTMTSSKMTPPPKPPTTTTTTTTTMVTPRTWKRIARMTTSRRRLWPWLTWRLPHQFWRPCASAGNDGADDVNCAAMFVRQTHHPRALLARCEEVRQAAAEEPQESDYCRRGRGRQ